MHLNRAISKREGVRAHLGTTNCPHIAAKQRFMKKVNKDGVGGNAEVHVMADFFFFFLIWGFFLDLEELWFFSEWWKSETGAVLHGTGRLKNEK